MRNDPLLFALSLARRAGKLGLGFDAVKDAVHRGQAQLVLTARDLSEGSYGRVTRLGGKAAAPLRLPHTQAELAAVTGKPVGVLSVNDRNLAVLCRKNVSPNMETESQEEYSE